MKELKKYYTIKSDLLYRRDIKVKPYYIYIILSILNKIPLHRITPSFSVFLTRFFKILHLKATFTILNRKLQFYIYSGIRDFKYHGGMPHEPRVSEVFLRLTPSNSVFYDIGSSIGWYSVLLADKCKKIIAFDPYEKSSLLNVKLNKINNFEFYPYFLSDRQELGEVEITTLDDLIIEKNFPLPDVIKIDVEDEEYKVLLGAKNLFNTNPPDIVLVETHSEKLFYECLEFLKPFNYQIYNLGCPKINTGGDIYPMSYNLETDVFYTKSETRTILGLKR